MAANRDSVGKVWLLIALAVATAVFAVFSYTGFGGLVAGFTKLVFVLLSMVLILALVVVWIRSFMGK